jgi:hypothetical protein
MLYAMLHEVVYDVAPLELEGATEFAVAQLHVGRFLREVFEGDAERCASFIKWTWRREESREKWRRDNGRDGGRIGWRLQFNRSVVSEWNVDSGRRLASAAAR